MNVVLTIYTFPPIII